MSNLASICPWATRVELTECSVAIAGMILAAIAKIGSLVENDWVASFGTRPNLIEDGLFMMPFGDN